MILKRLDFCFFSLLVGISITLFERFAKWAENAESGGYLIGVVLWKIEDGWLSLREIKVGLFCMMMQSNN